MESEALRHAAVFVGALALLGTAAAVASDEKQIEEARRPLLFSGDDLVWAPGLGIDARFQAPTGAHGLVPEWNLDGKKLFQEAA
jgi:hypothetical protein